jgi:hypothetical protein
MLKIMLWGRRTQLETNVQSLTVPLILIGTFAVSSSGLANEVSMHKHTAEEIKTVCDKVGGKFSQDAAG